MKRLIFATLAAGSLFVSSDLRAACSAASAKSTLSALLSQAPGLRADVLRMALDASGCAAKRGLVTRRNLLTVIDYSLPSSQPRLFVFDLYTRRLLFRELVAHGKSSGGNVANYFSNSPGSLASSLGLFVTEDTYVGHNGYSLRLRGLEEGVNDMALDRAIVMHGAYYVSTEAVKVLGRLGRSWGCPAVRSTIAKKLIDTLRGGSAIFAYYPEKSWLAHSEYLPHM
ncbi:MAG TPA: murein L,D-transpeptidase catalytic domain family protein [Thermoanaerobaculia bacterium]|jgi:hypothetical protein|nr:murein L,D-transpeptidase catalytic domain family protein [Thermoanaerobaculia bacterium]